MLITFFSLFIYLFLIPHFCLSLLIRMFFKLNYFSCFFNLSVFSVSEPVSLKNIQSNRSLCLSFFLARSWCIITLLCEQFYESVRFFWDKYFRFLGNGIPAGICCVAQRLLFSNPTLFKMKKTKKYIYKIIRLVARETRKITKLANEEIKLFIFREPCRKHLGLDESAVHQYWEKDNNRRWSGFEVIGNRKVARCKKYTELKCAEGMSNNSKKKKKKFTSEYPGASCDTYYTDREQCNAYCTRMM